MDPKLPVRLALELGVDGAGGLEEYGTWKVDMILLSGLTILAELSNNVVLLPNGTDDD